MAIFQKLRLECPECERVFQVDLFPTTKSVHCSRCKNDWRRDLDWDGPWYVKYSEHGRAKVESLGFVRKKVAEVREGQIKQALVEGRIVQKKTQSRMVFSELAEHYIEWAKDHKKANTMRSHRTRIAALNKRFRGIGVDSITLAYIESYRQRRLGLEKIAKNTVNNETSSMSAIFNFGVKMGMVQKNPCEKLERLAGAKGRDRIYTDREKASILRNAPEHLYPILYGYFRYGMRHQELLGVRRNQFNPVTKERQSFIDFNGELFSFWDTKNGSERIVPVPQDYLEILKAIPLPMSLGAKDFLFINSKGGPYKKITWAWNKTKELCLEMDGVDVMDATIHDMRRTFITKAQQRGVPVATAMNFTGIKTMKVLDQHYTKLEMRHKRDALDVMMDDPLIIKKQKEN